MPSLICPPTRPLAQEFVNLLESWSHRRGLPKVKALHLPPLRQGQSPEGEFCALELADGSLGLGFVLLDDTLAALRSSPDLGGLLGMDALDLARAYGRQQGLWKTLGMAAINALSRHIFDQLGYMPVASGNSIGALDPVPGEPIGMVGHFTPLIPKLVQSGARLTVLELRAELVGEKEGYRVSLDPQDLKDCRHILCTSSVLLNDTLDGILAHCRQAQSFALIGPGAGCLPDPLFARGVSLLGGTWVTDGALVREAILGGESWSKGARKFTLRREDYPGLAAMGA